VIDPLVFMRRPAFGWHCTCLQWGMGKSGVINNLLPSSRIILELLTYLSSLKGHPSIHPSSTSLTQPNQINSTLHQPSPITHHQSNMASTTSTPLPIHSTSTNPTKITIPDGRRNSKGEELPSPTQTWKPNFARTQSWDPQAYKRDMQWAVLNKEKENQGGKGEFSGFTEVKEEKAGEK
jgi:hypothetical protein